MIWCESSGWKAACIHGADRPAALSLFPVPNNIRGTGAQAGLWRNAMRK